MGNSFRNGAPGSETSEVTKTPVVSDPGAPFQKQCIKANETAETTLCGYFCRKGVGIGGGGR